MKEKQEKLKEEEQRNAAVEVSVGYDTCYYYDTYDKALSDVARPSLLSFNFLSHILRYILSIWPSMLISFFFPVF